MSLEIFDNFNNIDYCFYFSDSYKKALIDNFNSFSKINKFYYGLELIIYYSVGFYKLAISDNDYYDFIDIFEKKLEKYAEKYNKLDDFDKLYDFINSFNFYCSKKKKIIKIIQIVEEIIGSDYDFILINYKKTE